MNIFKQIFRSLYSPKDIATFRFQGIGKTILYVFILSLIFSLPANIRLATDFTTGINLANQFLQEKLPDFEIRNGELESEAKEPIIWRQGTSTFIFDPTGTLVERDVADYKNAIALLKEEFILVANTQVQTYPYATFNLREFDKQDITSFVATLSSLTIVLVPFMVILLFLFLSFVKFVEVSLLAFFGVSLKNSLKRNLKYKHLWVLSAYSITIPTIFFTIMHSLQVFVPFGIMIYWVSSFIVLYLSLKEIPASQKA
ncbi:DUF1189 domain-containing protein [Bacillus sp. HMF5848]|uniref:DUF1189 domain-containing protein n=1 Tax=Bacillus sp. HMF5848 TaxID=2495421 RepID=UPI000F77A3B5|nr:DUF1189 domain-containing protein [Bacillus sp. HMF5848]RSK27860.1 DUF1189 domain-containing protein [Bacillus sp. HMF5848]